MPSSSYSVLFLYITWSTALAQALAFGSISSSTKHSSKQPPIFRPRCGGVAFYSSSAIHAFRDVSQGRRAEGQRTSLNLFSPEGDGGGGIRRPPPRRALKKRKNKRREKMDQVLQSAGLERGKSNQIVEEDMDFIETRPMRKVDAVEAGLDYWIDETDLEKERQRRIATKNRKSLEGEISKTKLREEVVAPYKQNWIGLFSVVIVSLSAIVTKFPEMMQIPVIPIPDL